MAWNSSLTTMPPTRFTSAKTTDQMNSEMRSFVAELLVAFGAGSCGDRWIS